MQVKANYTEEDYYNLQELILNNEKPTKLNLIKYDLNNDGVLNSADYVTLANIIKEGD